MKDTQTLQALRDFLSSRGFATRLIERSSIKTPDLFADDGNNTYLLEVKTRLDSKEPAIVRTDLIGRSNRLSGKITEATRQLRPITSENIIRILWFLGQPPHQKTYYEQLRMTLYGIRVIVGRRKEGSIATVCYYAGHSDFFRYKDTLDGALLGTVAGLFINDYSPRADLLKKSRICSLSNDHVLDPRDFEQSEDILVLRDSVDRSNEAAVLQTIEARYGIENPKFEKMVKFSTFIP